MKKIIIFFSFALLFVFVLMNNIAVKASNNFTISIYDGASIRLETPAGLRFKGLVDGEISGSNVKYGIVFANGIVSSEDLVVETDKLDVHYAEVDEISEDGEFFVSMVNIPSRAYTKTFTARAYVFVDGEYHYSENVVSRNIYEVALVEKENNNSSTFISSLLDNCYEISYDYNGGNTSYKNHEEMVTDFLNDFESATGLATSADQLYENRGKFKDFLNNEKLLNKWIWAIQLFYDLSLEGIGYDATAQAQFKQILDGNVASATSYWGTAQGFECLLTRSFSKGYSNASTIDFGDYDNASLIEQYINGNTSSEILGNGASLLNNLYRLGYTFDGWYSDELFTNEVKTATTSQELYAKWNLVNYNINYVLDGGTLADDAKLSYNIIDAFSYPIPTKTDGTFLGWYLDSEFKYKAPDHVAGNYGDITLYAKWDMGDNFKINYVYDEGSLQSVTPSSWEEFTNAFWIEYHAWYESTDTVDAFKEKVLAQWSTKTAGDYPLYLLNGSGVTNEGYFINASANKDKWMPWMDTFESVIKNINNTATAWGSLYTGYTRIYEFFSNSTAAYWTDARKQTVYQAVQIEKQLITEYSLGDSFDLIGLVGENGKIFAGWVNENGDLIEKITPDTEGDLTLYASWNTSGLTEEELFAIAYQSVNLKTFVTTESINLPTSFENGVTGTWESSNENIMTSEGVVKTLNKFTNVTLTLTLGLDGSSKTEEYTYDLDIHVKSNLEVVRADSFNTSNMSNVELKNGRLELVSNASYGTYTSDVLETITWESLVPTWTAISSKNATVEFQIRARVNGTWSSYISYCSGGWGLGLQNSSTNTSNSYIKLSTDEIVVLNSKSADAIQFKLILRRTSTSYGSPSVSQVSFALKSAAFGGGSYSMSNLPTSVKYTVPKLYQQIVPTIGNSICSATSTTMLLKYKGLDFSSYDTYEHRYMAGIVRDYGNGIYGNWVYNCVTMGGYGFDAYVARLSNAYELASYLANVGPLAISVKGQMTSNLKDYYTGGHLLCLIGYTYSNGVLTFIANDPNVSQVECTYSLSVINSTWRNIVYIIE